MRALTIWQPWASLIAMGMKQYETRPRPTKVRGRLAIHAGMAMPCPRGRLLALHSDVNVTRDPYDRLILSTVPHGPRAIPVGAVIATAELVDCHQIEVPTRVTALEHALGNWGAGRWAWEFAEVETLVEPVPAKGKQGWWDWTPPEEVRP